MICLQSLFGAYSCYPVHRISDPYRFFQCISPRVPLAALSLLHSVSFIVSCLELAGELSEND
jgi:hypothetical protein